MENYFTLANCRRLFSVFFNNKFIHNFRSENRDKIWDGLMKDIFIGESCMSELIESSGARDKPICDVIT